MNYDVRKLYKSYVAFTTMQTIAGGFLLVLLSSCDKADGQLFMLHSPRSP